MGRTLPWKKQDAKRDVPRARTPAASLPHTRSSPPPKYSPPTSKSAKTGGTSGDGNDQAPPTYSPAKPKPMSERYMITGIHHDDRWRMVEDEFVAVAHKFTAHLHAAEYERLKEQVKDQNAEALRSLSRPVTGPMTDRVKRHHAALSLKKSQGLSIKRARARVQDADEDDGDELPWVGTNLENLMDSPRKKRIALAEVVTTSSDTRAAALLRKDNAGSKAPPSYRQPPVRFRTDDSRDGVSAQMTTNTLATKSFESGAPGSSTHTTYRPSSTTTGSAGSASIPALPRAVSASAANVPDDDSDSSVDLGFGAIFNKRASRRKR